MVRLRPHSASTLYDKSPEKLSEEEKRTVSSLSQVAAGIVGGSLSDSSDGAIIAAKTAKSAVENNDLSIRDNERVAKLEENLDKRGYLYPAELEEAKKLLNKSDLVDFLLSKAQKNKGNLHPELKNILILTFQKLHGILCILKQEMVFALHMKKQ